MKLEMIPMKIIVAVSSAFVLFSVSTVSSVKFDCSVFPGSFVGSFIGSSVAFFVVSSVVILIVGFCVVQLILVGGLRVDVSVCLVLSCFTVKKILDLVLNQIKLI